MKIIFVGLHNKPGKQPLDSTTKTGKIIDNIIAQLDGVECMKTNLFDVDYMPKGFTKLGELADNWIAANDVHESDIVVTLGRVAAAWMPTIAGTHLRLLHPSAMMRQNKVAEYIEKSVFVIKNFINESVQS